MKKKPKLIECAHINAFEGPSIPRLYGFYSTLICGECGSYIKLDGHGKVVGDWTKEPMQNEFSRGFE